MSCAVYEGKANPAEAREFSGLLASALELPVTTVLDVGLVRGSGWVLVEANAVWGSGLNGCIARDVLPCIARATSVEVPEPTRSASQAALG